MISIVKSKKDIHSVFDVTEGSTKEIISNFEAAFLLILKSHVCNSLSHSSLHIINPNNIAPTVHTRFLLTPGSYSIVILKYTLKAL